MTCKLFIPIWNSRLARETFFHNGSNRTTAPNESRRFSGFEVFVVSCRFDIRGIGNAFLILFNCR